MVLFFSNIDPMRQLHPIFLLIILAACSTDKDNQVVQKADADQILSNTQETAFIKAKEQLEYWSSKLAPDSSGIGDVAGLAGANSAMFQTTGDMLYLKAAESLYKKAIQISANNKDGFSRSLARNYISQHRFREAQEVLYESTTLPHNTRETHLVGFDIAMELGAYDEAGIHLKEIANDSEFEYLIRRSKWADNNGNLDEAIRYMEKAKTIADASNIKSLEVWANTNLADYYGHAGRIQESYDLYMKTLTVEPDNAYAIKGIAWIAYANDGNNHLALRLLDKAMEYHQAPDYHLLKSEVLAFDGQKEASELELTKFLEKSSVPVYGEMYNIYLMEVLSEKAASKALTIALREVINRPTPEAYEWLAYCQLRADDRKEALRTLEAHVEGKTYEPMALYHAALIYQANGMDEKAQKLLEELDSAAFELGPALMANIKATF